MQIFQHFKSFNVRKSQYADIRHCFTNKLQFYNHAHKTRENHKETGKQILSKTDFV